MSALSPDAANTRYYLRQMLLRLRLSPPTR